MFLWFSGFPRCLLCTLSFLIVLLWIVSTFWLVWIRVCLSCYLFFFLKEPALLPWLFVSCLCFGLVSSCCPLLLHLACACFFLFRTFRCALQLLVWELTLFFFFNVGTPLSTPVAVSQKFGNAICIFHLILEKSFLLVLFSHSVESCSFSLSL